MAGWLAGWLALHPFVAQCDIRPPGGPHGWRKQGHMPEAVPVADMVHGQAWRMPRHMKLRCARPTLLMGVLPGTSGSRSQLAWYLR